MRSGPRFSAALSLLLLALCSLPSSHGQSTANCAGYFRQRLYEQAGACFLKQAKALLGKSQLSPTQTHNLGRNFRNAAIAYTRAGNQSSQPPLKVFLYAQGYHALKRYLASKYCRAAQSCKGSRTRAYKLLQQIRFGTLTLRAGASQAQICLSGYRFRRCHRGSSWQIKLRPGKYRAQILYPGGFEKTRIIRLLPDDTQTIAIRIPFAGIRLETQPKGVKVFVSGALRGLTPLDLKLPAGTHTLQLQHPCYMSQSRTVRVIPGRSQSLSFRLVPDASAQKSTDPAPRKRLLAWGGVALGGLVLVFGVVAQGLAAQAHGDAQQKLALYNKREPKLTPETIAQRRQDYEDAGNLANAWQGGAIAGMILGAAGLGLGIYALLTLPRPKASGCPKK